MDSSPSAEAAVKLDDPDFQLVARAKKELPNRTTAYEELMRLHEKLLYRVCYRIMGNAEDAEDIFQDVMLKIYHGLVTFENRSSFKTWMCKIAHNTCYSSITRIARAREFQKLMHESDMDDETTMSDGELDSEKLLLSLAPEDRELLTLKYVAELKFEEIADICGLGISAVKMRIYRALDDLREKHKTW